MKPSHAIGLMILAVLATVAVEEFRISGLRSRLSTAETAASQPNASRPRTEARTDNPAEPESRPTRSAKRDENAAPSSDKDEEGFGKTVRKMWDNPAGKSMMNQGVKMAVAMMYGDFIDTLDLTKEEADYFRELLGAETAAQQELGMKLMSATPEERKVLMEDMERRRKENEEAIKTFLNDEKDQQRFDAYKERLPERQQLDGLRAAMAGKDASLDAGTEEKLVEAMYRARKQPGITDFSGADGMKAMAEGNMTESFEESWEQQQAALHKEVGGILDAKQQEAFFEYQKQMKDFQLMGIKMAEKMMAPGEKAE